MVKGIIFDMDGVLLDTEIYHYEAWKRVFLPFGIHLTEPSYGRLCQAQGRTKAITNVLGDVDTLLVEDLSEKKGKIYHQVIQEEGIHVFEDTLWMLEKLQEHKIAMAVGSSSKVAKKILKKLDYERFFDTIVDGNDIHDNKPHPEVFQKACLNLGLKANEVVVIEDAISGVTAARRGGMNAFLLEREEHGFKQKTMEDLLKNGHIRLTLQEKNNIEMTRTWKAKDFRQIFNKLFIDLM